MKFGSIVPIILLVCMLSFRFHSPAGQAQGRGIGTNSNRISVESERRTALVIGNGAYVEAPLRNPANDAASMTELLKSLGFNVIGAVDADLRKMDSLIGEFTRSLSSGGVGLFYFAGHGVQVEGENYLIPVGSGISSESEVKYRAVPVGLVMAGMQDAGNGLNIIILDACRNNPFPRGYRSAIQGLAGMKAPSGTIIAYATQPGNVALDGQDKHGLYTGELLANLRVPGLSIEEVFKRTRIAVMTKTGNKQEPWEATSLRGDFYPSGRMPSQVSTDRLSPEEEHWRAIADSHNPELFRGYLGRYPNGKFRDTAEARLRMLESEQSSQPGSGQLFWKIKDEAAIQVPASSGWMRTQLVVASGEKLEISASGQINLGRNSVSGPEGKAENIDHGRPSPDCPTGALIARVGSSIYCIRSYAKFDVGQGGTLYLGINEEKTADNSGVLNVRVKVMSPFKGD